MNKENLKYIYGPVSSWRLGSSLGIDLLSQEAKVCSIDCVYCQLGRTIVYSTERKIYVPTEQVVEELEMLHNTHVDYITFSGRGEPTLAKNLGQVIKAVKTFRTEPVAVLTNSFLMDKEDVREELNLADFVAAKLDAYSPGSFKEINRPANNVEFGSVLDGVKRFRKAYTGKFALQIMFIEQNKKHASEVARIAKEINPDEVQINTPLRPCKVKPLSKQELDEIKHYFEGLNVISVYEASKKEVKPLSGKDTLVRRGKIG